MYEYKFIKVPFEGSRKEPIDVSFDKCKEIIIQEANNGWRLKQVVVPANEKTGVYGAHCYQIIFEKHLG